MNQKFPRILVVAPFMHRPGHFSTFPLDLARGFAFNGASVTLLHPFQALSNTNGLYNICLEQQKQCFNIFMKLVWRVLQNHPILLCLGWIVFHTCRNDYDMVYWTDFEPDNQQSTWPLALGYYLGLYRHRTAFTEHHQFNWSRHRWQRSLRLDRIRLRHFEMFVHSKRLLDGIRQNMQWVDKGHYLPWGLWPDPATADDRAAARERMAIPHDARLLLVFGIQAIQRKHIDTLAEALYELPLSVPLFIIFAGKRVSDEHHPFDAAMLTAKTNLFVRHVEAFIPDEEVKLYFAAADAVWAYYGKFQGASGIFAQAIAYARLPICASNSESGELCNKYKVGLVTPIDDVSGVRSVITRFLNMNPKEQTLLEEQTQSAAEVMSWPNIARGILDVVFQNAGQSPATFKESPRRT